MCVSFLTFKQVISCLSQLFNSTVAMLLVTLPGHLWTISNGQRGTLKSSGSIMLISKTQRDPGHLKLQHTSTETL